MKSTVPFRLQAAVSSPRDDGAVGAIGLGI